MKDWRNLKTGDRVIYHTEEFDGSITETGNITEVHEDHAILRVNGMNLWIDDNTEYLFKLA